MLTNAYIAALLVDEELADQVWEAWDAGEIDDQIASIAWMLIAVSWTKLPGNANESTTVKRLQYSTESDRL